MPATEIFKWENYVKLYFPFAHTKTLHYNTGRMKTRVKEPPTPLERYNTIRRYIISLLEEHVSSARDISVNLRIPEKDVSGHLEHIRRTLHKNSQHLIVAPAQCEKCSFVFTKRTRLTKPGKCPICHSSLIKPPLFSISGNLREGVKK